MCKCVDILVTMTDPPFLTKCVLVVKYIVHYESRQPYISYGISGVAQNALIMLR